MRASRTPGKTISIHPPRVGRDETPEEEEYNERCISIHPPRVGRDGPLARWKHRNVRFQSTLPVWGGTAAQAAVKATLEISIHPPRVGRDIWAMERVALSFGFQSTLPVWGGT